VRVAQQALALGDLGGSFISMWIVEVLGANPHQLGELRGLLLGAAYLRGNVADVLGLDVAVLVALLRVHPTCTLFSRYEVGHLLDLLRASRSECIHTVMHVNASYLECIRMQRMCMHLNALICITFRMHTYGNAHECITCSKCMIMQQRMEMHRIIDA
jgi:hypothetical protein